MANKLIGIPYDNAHNYPFRRLKLAQKRLNTLLNESNNSNSLVSPKLLSKRIRKCYHKTLGTIVINNSFSLGKICNLSLIKAEGIFLIKI